MQWADRTLTKRCNCLKWWMSLDMHINTFKSQIIILRLLYFINRIDLILLKLIQRRLSQVLLSSLCIVCFLWKMIPIFNLCSVRLISRLRQLIWSNEYDKRIKSNHIFKTSMLKSHCLLEAILMKNHKTNLFQLLWNQGLLIYMVQHHNKVISPRTRIHCLLLISTEKELAGLKERLIIFLWPKIDTSSQMEFE